MSKLDNALWANYITRQCLLEADGDVEVALKAASHIIATQPVPDNFAMSVDEQGNTHDAQGRFSAHELTADAYETGHNAIRSGRKDLHAKASEQHKKASLAHSLAAKTAKGEQKKRHLRLAIAHSKSAKRHDRSAGDDAAMSTDASGHEHKGKGAGGGQFTSKGGEWKYSDSLPSDSEWEDIKPDPKYFYHATSKDNLGDIQETGNMVGFRPSHGTDQSTWPDGSTERRIYFTDKPKTARLFIPEGSKPALIRVKRHKLIKPEKGTGDFYLQNKKYPTHRIEVLTTDGWKPVATKDAPLSIAFSHDIQNPAAQAVLTRSLKEAKGLSAAAKKDLAIALRQDATGGALVSFVNKYRLQLAKALSYTQLAALLEGAQEVANKIPTQATFPGAVPPPPTLEPEAAVKLVNKLEAEKDAVKRAEIIEALPKEQQAYATQAVIAKEAYKNLPPPQFTPQTPDNVHLHTIEEAVKNLSERNVMDHTSYDALDAAARAKAFTVANVSAEETLTKIRDSLAENVKKGADFDTWEQAVLKDVESGTFLSEAHQENVFRTNIQTAFSDGQQAVLNHPLVRNGFPYSAYDAIHDDRVREDHLALEKHGIQGTNIYRNDDPVFQLFRPPWDYNDRCGSTPLTVRQAAEKGIEEAKEWLRTGVEPTEKAFVKMPPFQPPEGFKRSVAAAPLSIQLSMQSVAAFDIDTTGAGISTFNPISDFFGLPVFNTTISAEEKAKKLEEWHDREKERADSLKFLEKATKELRKDDADLDAVDTFLKKAGARAERLRALSRLRHRAERGRIDSVELEEAYENEIEQIFKAIEAESSIDKEPTEPVSAMMAIDGDDETHTLIARILALLHDTREEAEAAAHALVEDHDAAFAMGVGPPKTKKRYGAKPGPGWHPGGISRTGKQIWIWGASPGHTPASPSPAPHSAPIPGTPAAFQPTSSAMPQVQVVSPIQPTGQYVASHQNRLARATQAYNDAMATLQNPAGGILSAAQKKELSVSLSVMNKQQLRSLYAALGGTAAIVGTQRQPWVHAIKGIMAGAPSAAPTPVPPPSPTPTPAPTPAAPATPAKYATKDDVRKSIEDKMLLGKIDDSKKVLETAKAQGFDEQDLDDVVYGVRTNGYASYSEYLTLKQHVRDIFAPAPAPLVYNYGSKADVSDAIYDAVKNAKTQDIDDIVKKAKAAGLSQKDLEDVIDDLRASWSIITPTIHASTKQSISNAFAPAAPAGQASPINSLATHLQSPAAQTRAIALAVKDGLMTKANAETEIHKVFSTLSNPDRDSVVDALAKGVFKPRTATAIKLIDEIIKNDPGHGTAPSPPGPPPWAGLQWDATKHRWVKIPTGAAGAATSAAPTYVSKTGYTHYDGVINDVLAGKVVSARDLDDAVRQANISVPNADIADAINALGGTVTNLHSSLATSSDLRAILTSVNAANQAKATPPPAAPPTLGPGAPNSPAATGNGSWPSHLMDQVSIDNLLALVNGNTLAQSEMTEVESALNFVGGKDALAEVSEWIGGPSKPSILVSESKYRHKILEYISGINTQNALASTAAPASPPTPTPKAQLGHTSFALKDENEWESGKPQTGLTLHGIEFKPAPPKFWEKVKDVNVNEPEPLKKIDRVSVMIQEPDGRIWIVQPTNAFGNRKYTMPGGGVESGLTNQQNALKEIWEETGLQVEITGFAGDFEDSNNGNNGRLYIGRRIGGAPWDAKPEPKISPSRRNGSTAESEAVSLVTPEKAAQLLHRTDDLAQLIVVHPIKIGQPAKGKGSEPLKKLFAAIQPKAAAYSKKNKTGDASLHAVQEMRGFNAKPKVVDKKEMDKLIKDGNHIDMLRGLKPLDTYDYKTGKYINISAKDLAEQFRSGDHFPGYGCFGNGTYFDSNKSDSGGYYGSGGNKAYSYAGGSQSYPSSSGAIVRCALPKTAKIIKQSELEKKVNDYPGDYKPGGGHQTIDQWLGVQAALAGYDAIHVDGNSSRHGSYGKGFYVILNRGAVVVQKEDASTHKIK